MVSVCRPKRPYIDCLLVINVLSEIIGKNIQLVHLHLAFGMAISYKLEQICYYYYYYYYYYNHFMAHWTLSGTTWMSQYQKVHFTIFWIFWC